jgi:hypothetical protein
MKLMFQSLECTLSVRLAYLKFLKTISVGSLVVMIPAFHLLESSVYEQRSEKMTEITAQYIY